MYIPIVGVGILSAFDGDFGNASRDTEVPKRVKARN